MGSLVEEDGSPKDEFGPVPLIQSPRKLAVRSPRLSHYRTLSYRALPAVPAPGKVRLLDCSVLCRDKSRDCDVELCGPGRPVMDSVACVVGEVVSLYGSVGIQLENRRMG